MVSVMCILSVFVGIVLFKPETAIYGTYKGMYNSVETYAVMQKDQSYAIYQQFQNLDEGKYHKTDSREKVSVYELNSADGYKTYTMVNIDDIICIVMDGKSAVIMKKISNIPIYIE